MKKIITIILLMIITVFITSCSADTEKLRDYSKIINPADKTVLSDDAMASRFLPPSMETNLMLADILIDGTVTEAITKSIRTPSPSANEDPYMPEEIEIELFVIKVNDVIMGEYNEEIIYSLIMSNVTQPKIGENVILFVDERVVGDFKFYVPVDGEHSTFAYDDKKERLYSFSNTEELSAFDGKHKSELFEVVMASDNFKNAAN